MHAATIHRVRERASAIVYGFYGMRKEILCNRVNLTLWKSYVFTWINTNNKPTHTFSILNAIRTMVEECFFWPFSYDFFVYRLFDSYESGYTTSYVTRKSRAVDSRWSMHGGILCVLPKLEENRVTTWNVRPSLWQFIISSQNVCVFLRLLSLWGLRQQGKRNCQSTCSLNPFQIDEINIADLLIAVNFHFIPAMFRIERTHVLKFIHV